MERRRVDGRFVAEAERQEREPEPEQKKAKGKAPRPMYCRTYTRARVAKALPGIVEKFLEEAMKGSVPHAKAVMVLGGLDRGDIVPRAIKRRSKSLASILMEELKRSDAAAAEKKPGE